jgi:hypothetical protein
LSDAIPLSTLEEMFERMRQTPELNVDGHLLWGYFFFNATKEPLAIVAEELMQAGYSIVRLEPADDESCYVLHVERIELHSPRSLYERNIELAGLAQTHGVESYDGMDVGPVAGIH